MKINWKQMEVYGERAMSILSIGFFAVCLLLLLSVAFGVFVMAWNYWK